jgi:hypothetical protein
LATRSETPEEKAIFAEKRRSPRTWKLRRPWAAGSLAVLRSREKETPSRGGAGQSRGRLEAADEVVPVLSCWNGLTRHKGSRSLESRCLESSDEGCVLEPSGKGGSRIRGVEGESSRGDETQESIGRPGRGNPTRSRTDSREGEKLRSR